MSNEFDSETTNLMARALQGALDRLGALGLVDGDAAAARSCLTKLIIEAMDAGERKDENLILFAMGRFQPPAKGSQ
jgi:hypothetical protein